MKSSLCLAVTVFAVLASPSLAHAAERVMLRNGFSLQCSHHLESDGRVRLFSDQGDDNYVELGSAQIAGYESVPDPKPSPVASQPAALSPAPRVGARLSPQDLREILVRAGREHNVDVDLLASVVKAESGGNTHAVSRTGARGLMQLMPATAAGLGVKDSFQPDENVRGGTAYLDALLTQYHDNLALALAAYNAGTAAVAKYRGIPPYYETRAYIARVIHEFNRRVRDRRVLEQRAAAARTNEQAKADLPGANLAKTGLSK